MNEHSHIDKIFKEGIGERNFSNADAMWERMETELDKEKDKKKRPIVFLIASAALLATGIWVFQKLNHTIVTDNSVTVAKNTNHTAKETASKLTVQPGVVSNNMQHFQEADIPASINVPAGSMLQPKIASAVNKQELVKSTAMEDDQSFISSQLNHLIVLPTEDYSVEKMAVTASLLTEPNWGNNSKAITPVVDKFSNSSNLKPVKRNVVSKSGKITIEAVGGGDLIRLNRKAGFYAGLRVNRKLENGTLVSAGVNFASHIIRDKYRIRTKPAEQRTSDARINSISSVRVPVYLQRQMGTSKFSMMVGLVPTYITSAEVYNVPNSYIGDPDPYRKFDLDDINRFNLLFGAGLRYSATKWVSIELSGSYGLTGMVKDGYKNLSRVNDNFKSIQLGAAFRLK